MKIFVNPGHMVGVDCGAVNETYDATEAEIVLSIGEKLVNLLQQQKFDVYFEQSDNIAGERASTGEKQYYQDSLVSHSNDWGADIFISIHANASGDSGASGTETFYGSVEGAELARCVQDRLVYVLESYDRGIRNGSKYAVIRKTDAVAILVETLFIDNDEDCLKLMDEDYQNAIAKAISSGVVEYVQDR